MTKDGLPYFSAKEYGWCSSAEEHQIRRVDTAFGRKAPALFTTEEGRFLSLLKIVVNSMLA